MSLIDVGRQGRVAIVTLRHPPANVMNLELTEEIASVFPLAAHKPLLALDRKTTDLSRYLLGRTRHGSWDRRWLRRRLRSEPCASQRIPGGSDRPLHVQDCPANARGHSRG